MEQLGQGCSAGGVGDTLGMLSPVGSPSHGPSPCPCPLEGLSPRAVGRGQAPWVAHPGDAPRHSSAVLVLSRPRLPQPARQHHPAGPKHSPGPRAAPFTGPKLSSPLPVNPYRPRAGNWAEPSTCFAASVILGPLCAAWPRGSTDAARGAACRGCSRVAGADPAMAGAVPTVTGPWLTVARGCRLAWRWLPGQ